VTQVSFVRSLRVITSRWEIIEIQVLIVDTGGSCPMKILSEELSWLFGTLLRSLAQLRGLSNGSRRYVGQSDLVGSL